MFNHPAGPHGRPGRSPIRLLRTASLAGAFALAGISGAPAADPIADPAFAKPAIADVLLARAALAALDSDSQLRDVNLIVSVVDRVAVIGGSVPSPELGKRAEAVVRAVAGIAEVKNRCFVVAGPDPLLRAMSERVVPSPRRLLAHDLPGVVASPRTGAVEEMPMPLPSSNLAAVEPAEQSVVALRPANPGASILLPPVASLIAPPRTVAPVTAPVPPVVLTSVASRPADALAAAEVVRKADRRYAGLTVAHANGTLVVAGTAGRAADAWDLAQDLRKLPGVVRVAVGAIGVDSGK